MLEGKEVKTGATFSSCGKYRYKLWRIWDSSRPMVAFCMLNPSTADETKNDPTVERCQQRAEHMGYGGLFVINIFAYRSTDPKELKKVEDPIGAMNNLYIVDVAQISDMVVCGWGKHGSMNGRGEEVLEILKHWVSKKQVRALRLNRDGSPAHPLYIGYDVRPVPIDFCKQK